MQEFKKYRTYEYKKLPEFFIAFLTEKGDTVSDFFAGLISRALQLRTWEESGCLLK